MRRRPRAGPTSRSRSPPSSSRGHPAEPAVYARRAASREASGRAGRGDRWDMLRPASMRLDALLDLDRELFLLVNRVQGAVWDLGFGYGTWLGDGRRRAAAALARPARVRPPPLSEEPADHGDRDRDRLLRERRPQGLDRAPAAAARSRVRRLATARARAPAAGRAAGGGVRDPRSALERARARRQADRPAPSNAIVSVRTRRGGVRGRHRADLRLPLAPPLSVPAAGGLRRPLARRLRRALSARRGGRRAARRGRLLRAAAGLRAVPRPREPSRSGAALRACPPGAARA